MNFKHIAFIAAACLALTSCNNDDPVIPEPEGTVIPDAKPNQGASYRGFYILNEGNMGSNKCTLDYYSYRNCTYTRNIYSAANPNEILELGDTGSDIAVHDGRLYVVVNGSHKVEVLDAATAVKIAKVDISSPRSIAFDGDYAYVTSFVGGSDDNGSVVRFSTRDFKPAGTVPVGKMPEGLAVRDGSLYVANSGDYTNQEYKNYISVIDLATFTEKGHIEAPINLQYIAFDALGKLWVSSRGNYADKASCLVYYTPDASGTTVASQWKQSGSVDTPVSNMTMRGNSLYYIGATYGADWKATYTLGTVDTATPTTPARSFITDGTQSRITTPYCLAVNPDNGDIIVTDVKNYVSSGTLFYYSADGKLQWTATTGDIPGHIAFVK